MTQTLPLSIAPTLIGHNDDEQHFLKLNASNRLHHGWLITGPSGIGKGALAVRMARVLLGGAKPDMFGDISMDFTADDSYMHRLSGGGHPDFMYLYLGMDSLKTKDRQCTDIPVDYIRLAKVFLHKTSAESKNKVLIIDDADSINNNGANALLKILEEPHPHTYIILVTAKPNTLLPTIRSRCSVLNLQKLDSDKIQTILKNKYPALTDGELEAYCKLSDGSIGKAINYVDNNVLPLYSQMINAMAVDSSAVYTLVSSLTGKANEKNFPIFADLVNGWLGRLALSSVKGIMTNPVITAEQQAYDRISSKYKKIKLLEWIDVVKRNINSVKPPRHMDKKTVVLTTFLSLHDGR